MDTAFVGVGERGSIGGNVKQHLGVGVSKVRDLRCLGGEHDHLQSRQLEFFVGGARWEWGNGRGEWERRESTAR